MSEEPATPAAGEDGDDVARLRQRIAELEARVEQESAQATEYMKKWQYSEAELANVRRRAQQEREELARFGAAPLTAMLLEVLDNFERAEQTVPAPLHSYTWISGIMLIHRQLRYLLQQQGIEPIETAEQRYDPALHEAVAQEPHATLAEGMIVGEVQRGYRMHGRVLRPALVRISQGPAPAEAPTAGKEQAAEAATGESEPAAPEQHAPRSSRRSATGQKQEERTETGSNHG